MNAGGLAISKLWPRGPKIKDPVAIKVSLLWNVAVIARRLRLQVSPSWKIVRARLLSEEERAAGEFFPSAVAVGGPATNTSPDPTNDRFPALRFRHFEDVLVTGNRRCSYVISGNELLLPPAVQDGPWNIRVGTPVTGGIHYQQSNDLLAELGQKLPVLERGLYVGSWSPHNWYHWTIDTLPSVYLSRKLPADYDDFPLLLPEKALTKASWDEPLQIVRGTRDIVALPQNQYLKVRELLWIDSPSVPGPLPLRASGHGNFRIHYDAMREYRKFMLEALQLCGTPKPHKKIYLARKEGAQRTYNQSELIAVARDYGYEPIFLEELSFGDSVKIMTEAKLVVGPHGAGWANALYCQPSTQGFMWSWQDNNWNWFLNVANTAGFSLEHYQLKSSEGLYDLDRDIFEGVLRKFSGE